MPKHCNFTGILCLVALAFTGFGCTSSTPVKPKARTAKKAAVKQARPPVVVEEQAEPIAEAMTEPEMTADAPTAETPGTETPVSETPPAAETPPKAAVKITLKQLEQAADASAEFDRKQVEFTAKVARPGYINNVVGGLTIFLTNDGSMTALLGGSPFITAVFPFDTAESTRLRTLPPMSDVTVSGELRMAAKNVWELHNTTLVKVADDPSVAMTATELTKAYLDDDNASAKHANKSLKISGKVIGKPAPFGQYAAVCIKGATDSQGRPTTVVAQFRPEHFNLQSEPREGESLASELPWKDGDDIEVYGTLQTGSFGEDPEGRPTLALDAYPVKWPIQE